jgi:hypothetical protein
MCRKRGLLLIATTVIPNAQEILLEATMTTSSEMAFNAT